jgi:prophage antirepressor-like protein
MTTELFKNKDLGIEMNTYYINGNIWFKGQEVATLLEYADTDQAIRKNVDFEDKAKCAVLLPVSGTGSPEDPRNVFINESGFYSLVMRSKMNNARKFQRWVTKDVLPSIRKTGQYHVKRYVPKPSLTFNIQNERDLHYKVINFIKTKLPNLIVTAGLGEMQDTKQKRIECSMMGYSKGTPDITIHNLTSKFNGFAIELKTPNGKGVTSPEQTDMLNKFKTIGYKTLNSNDYDDIICQLIEYNSLIRIKCQYCTQRFKSNRTLKNHSKYFHRIE